MPISARYRNRLAAIEAKIRPDHSLAARLETIADEQREEYQRWRDRYDQWLARELSKVADPDNHDEHLYVLSLRGRHGPRLRGDIDIALNGPKRTIPATIATINPLTKRSSTRKTTDDDAEDIYRKYCDDQR